MRYFGVNLKRFDVPISRGGICPSEEPDQWIKEILFRCADLGLGRMDNLSLTFFLPESLLIPAVSALKGIDTEKKRNFFLGSQGVYREDIKKGGNFGAFTANLPAQAIEAMGLDVVLIGHSEERADKFSLLVMYDPKILSKQEHFTKAGSIINTVIGEEAERALQAGLSVMLCVGETAEEKGDDSLEEQEKRVRHVLKTQITESLNTFSSVSDDRIVIAYEPRWAIGPGRTPPKPEYIGFVSSWIKEVLQKEFGVVLPVLYGGGLKEENSADIGNVDSIDGGLVALTKFTPPIGFDPGELRKIIDLYVKGDERGDL